MKLTFKDLKQQKFVIDAEPTDTISQVKEKINKEKGWDAAAQKLIYSGKILQDDKTVGDYKIEEKGFVVCMISNKPKAASSSSAAGSSSASTPVKAPSTPAQSSVPPTPSAPAQAVTGSSTSTSAAVPETPTPAGAVGSSASLSPATFNDPSALAMGGEREDAIVNMMGMGFERSEIERAMRAAFFNPDRAVDYLLNGIPEHLTQERPAQSSTTRPAAQSAQSAARPAAATAPATGGSASGEGAEPENINLFEAAAAAASQRGGAHSQGRSGGAASLGNLDFLRNNPQFQQLRQVVQQQPQMLEPILQQVGMGNPQLAATISSNPEAFLRLLSEDPADEDGGALPPGSNHISVTPEESDAIERLCRLGFDRDMVIQAYFACDKNEELAANFLFEQPDDDMDG